MTASAPSWARLLLVYAAPPSLVALLAAALWLPLGSGDPRSVEVRVGELVVRTATSAEALDDIEERTGMRPLLPAVLPQGGYELSQMSAVEARPPATGYVGVSFRYDRAGRAASWFWVNQFVPDAITIPDQLPRVTTTVEGARLWTLGEPPPDATEPNVRFQFIARTLKYDRVISFEGAERPDMDEALEVIESMLRQD